MGDERRPFPILPEGEVNRIGDNQAELTHKAAEVIVHHVDEMRKQIAELCGVDLDVVDLHWSLSLDGVNFAWGSSNTDPAVSAFCLHKAAALAAQLVVAQRISKMIDGVTTPESLN